ncbi:hypothetical protein Adt_35897 [Abeliophyllum distichum]|uniref:Uncharacterized protein n=1 Tax=Abeliophyllum distichum TaxID=126358 RepID=A0ABD1QG19_9LAMI
MYPFFCEVLKDWNLAPCQITPNGWGQMVALYTLWVFVEVEGNLTPREFESIYWPVDLRVGIMFLLDRVKNGERPPIVPTKCTTGRRGSSSYAGTESLYRRIPFPMCQFLADSGNLWRGFFGTSFRYEASGPSQEAQDAAPSNTIPPPRLEADANVLQHPPSSSNLHIDSTSLRDKWKKIVKGTEEAPAQKRNAPAATEGLMRDARKVRRTEEGRRSSPSLDGKPEGAENSASSVGQNRRIRISERREELPASVMEMLPVHPSIVAASVHRYWTPSWEKVTEEVTVLERLQLAEVNLVRGLVLAKDIFSAFTSFDAEDSKSKKLTEDLKVMGLEKVQLESDKRALQFKLDLVMSKEADMKAKYEIELKAAKECLKQARDQMMAIEASQKRVEEAQKLAEDRTLAAETTLAATNSSLEAAAADNERSLIATKLELEKIKAERADAEAKAVEAYQDAFVDTSMYQDLAQRLMIVGGEQLVERIMEAHLEWDLSFLREAPAEAHAFEADPGDTRVGDEGPSCTDP